MITMDPVWASLCAGLLTLSGLLLHKRNRRKRSQADHADHLLKRRPELTAGPRKLLEHTKQFEKRVIATAREGKVHSVVGFGIANCVVLEGKKLTS